MSKPAGVGQPSLNGKSFATLELVDLGDVGGETIFEHDNIENVA